MNSCSGSHSEMNSFLVNNKANKTEKVGEVVQCQTVAATQGNHSARSQKSVHKGITLHIHRKVYKYIQDSTHSQGSCTSVQ